MPSAELREVLLEFHGCTVFGKVDVESRLDLQLCGHGMEGDDAKDASEVVSWLVEHGTGAERSSECKDCGGTCGCFLVPLGQPIENLLHNLMEAVGEKVRGGIGEKVELTFTYADKRYAFSARWACLPGSLVSPTHYYIDNTWTYFEKNPSEQLLERISNVRGVRNLKTEALGTGSTALDIVVSASIQDSLEACLIAVTDILAAS